MLFVVTCMFITEMIAFDPYSLKHVRISTYDDVVVVAWCT